MKKKCIQIGAGLSEGASWIDYDNSPTLLLSKIPLIGRLLLKLMKGPRWSRNTKYGDIVSGLPLSNGSCDLIFCSHMLEHLSLPDFEIAIRNIFNHLKVGGTFRFIVPDLEVYAKRYLEKIEQRGNQDKASVDFMKESGLGCENSRRGFVRRFRETLANSRHQWLWDKHSLIEVLKRHGFRDIRQCRYGEWTDSHFSEVEEPGRHTDSLCLECCK